MTSEEIKDSVPLSQMDPEHMPYEQAYWLREIAYQLAIRNEGEGLDTE